MLGIDFKEIAKVGGQVTEFVAAADQKMKILNENDHALMRELKIIQAQNSEILRRLAIVSPPIVEAIEHDRINAGGD